MQAGFRQGLQGDDGLFDNDTGCPMVRRETPPSRCAIRTQETRVPAGISLGELRGSLERISTCACCGAGPDEEDEGGWRRVNG
jgi:hypothetical protein